MPKLIMSPDTGERVLRFVGDSVRFALRAGDGAGLPPDWRGFLRTNLGRAETVREEIVRAYTGQLPLAGASWRDVPLRGGPSEWWIELPVTEVGYFKAKAYAADSQGRQHWPAGPDVGIAVHPDSSRTANTIYCAFVRLFGAAKGEVSARDEGQEVQFKGLDKNGFTVIPPSGKLHDLIEQLPHIIHTLGCRILHLLPICPTPTTYARFGRYGSPYACLDFTAIDPALVVFDRRTTGLDQFGELTYAVHSLGGRLFLDLAINHTGWGSVLQENHPQWFVRSSDGTFVSPGAWGTVWEDLCELSHRSPDLWEYLARAFLVWCERGVDGFRCDAGYKVPLAAWQYIIARVRQEFPATLFLLEGLGGAWEATEDLLGEGGMQWAYSELFQNYSGRQVASYLDYSMRQSQRAGLWVHYSETHDNHRLAGGGRAWSLLRNRLCGLTSVGGGFGFTCGVEWLATEKILVHQCTGLAWGKRPNLVNELSQLNRLVAEHPCFFDGARLTRLSPVDSPIYVLRRDSSEGADHVLVLVNTDASHQQSVMISESVYRELGEPGIDLLGQPPPRPQGWAGAQVRFVLEPAACYCLANLAQPKGLSGENYRRARAQAAWALTALSQALPMEQIGNLPWRALAEWVVRAGPLRFLAAVSQVENILGRMGWEATGPETGGKDVTQGGNPGRLPPPSGSKGGGRSPETGAGPDLMAELEGALARPSYAKVVLWEPADRQRITLIPPQHWLLINDSTPFKAALRLDTGTRSEPVASLQIDNMHFASFAPDRGHGEAQLVLERYAAESRHVQAPVRFLIAGSGLPPIDTEQEVRSVTVQEKDNRSGGLVHGVGAGARLRWDATGLVLLTNGRGGMARLGVDLGRVKSKYDCLLAANLHPSFPVDRHVLAKRVRAWVNADGFLSPLDGQNLVALVPGPPANWRFVANAGDGRSVEIRLAADMLNQCNTTVLRFTRPKAAPPWGKDLPDTCEVRLTVRVDIEDRNFHSETRANPGAEYHFTAHCRPLRGKTGFEFTPASDRQLRVFSDVGSYHQEAEWCYQIPHPVEQSRGQVASGDAFSPGWFELPLPKGGEVTVTVCADPADPEPAVLKEFAVRRHRVNEAVLERAGLPSEDTLGRQLALSIQAFVARRNGGKTVIAGYPWFLDWGRDSLLCARGMVAAGMLEEVKQLLLIFGQFERDGTLPNSIHGQDVSNRDTSDAPLWFGLACEEAATVLGDNLYRTVVDQRNRTLADVLRRIAVGYARGTPNGIRMDAGTGLIWSPKHFTWMDTNFPAGTPREGYPVEVQALWIRLLRQLDHLEAKAKAGATGLFSGSMTGEPWRQWAERAESNLKELYWQEDRGYLVDVLAASPGVGAKSAVADNALRSNYLLAVSLDIITGERAQRCVESARRYLVVPGALRSLAPLKVSPPLPIHGSDGRLLNNPDVPYWGRYEGDEDTRRKPAYHNGTAWTWTFPIFCEALARAWNFAPEATAAAKAYLRSMERLLGEGCLGHVPELLDGDAPHWQRGCDAQAWGATEALRVWKLLNLA